MLRYKNYENIVEVRVVSWCPYAK